MSESCCPQPDGVRLYIGEGMLRGYGQLTDSFPKKADDKGQRSPTAFRMWSDAECIADNQRGDFQQIIEHRGGVMVRAAERERCAIPGLWHSWKDATSPKETKT